MTHQKAGRCRRATTQPVHQRNSSSLLEQSESSVRMLDPVNVLKRGFSITQIKGKAILKATSLKEGDRIKTTFYEGTIESEVTGN
ncbi:MAG: hypothetical protein IPP71_17090 [Bacteroidetes bacterium]|nr:hypothetical protein [Bacteroidota bacterium]